MSELTPERFRDAAEVNRAMGWHDTAETLLHRNIVNGSDRLIAIPDGPEKPSGGTWYTVRYALSVGKGVTIYYPDGTVEDRLPTLTAPAAECGEVER